MMPHRYLSAEEMEQVIRLLKHKQKLGYQPGRKMHGDYCQWCEQRGKPIEACHETIRKWLDLSKMPTLPIGEKSRLPRRRKTSFYDFVIELGENLDLNDWPGMLAKSVNTLFPSGHADDAGILDRLGGPYELIQRQWRPAGTDDLIASIVQFRRLNRAVEYSERQNFVSGYPVDAKYEGYTFLSGSSVWIIAQEARRQSFKFLTIHYFDPPLMAALEPFYVCRGNLTSVWGSNDNPSHRFILRQPTEGKASCRILSKEQAKIFLDQNDYNYLYSAYGKEQH